jgi:uncharacterized protein (TIRG00374 family)
MSLEHQFIRKHSTALAMSNRKRWIVALGIVISGVFLWIAFHDLKPEAVLASIQQVNMIWLAAATVVFFVSLVLIALRWQYLLRAIAPVSLSSLVQLVSIGYMGNNVYPFRSGEVLRIVLLQRNDGVPMMKTATTVVIERIFDGLVMLSFIVISLSLLDVSSQEIRQVASFTAPIFLAAMVVFILLAAKPGVVKRLLELVSHLLPGRLGEILLRIGEDVVGGLAGLRSPADLVGAILSSFLSWGVHAVVYWMVAFAFQLEVTYVVMLLAVGVVNLVGLIPASPGQIGVFEFFVGLVLRAVGVDEASATAYALVAHVVIWLPVTLAGFYFLARQGLNWQAVTHARELEQPAGG